MREQEHGKGIRNDNTISNTSIWFRSSSNCTISKQKFVTVKELLEDKILVNELLKNEIKSLGKNSRKSAPKNNRRTYRRKPKKQVEK
mgnify:CR=1 FL=1